MFLAPDFCRLEPFPSHSSLYCSKGNQLQTQTDRAVSHPPFTFFAVLHPCFLFTVEFRCVVSHTSSCLDFSGLASQLTSRPRGDS
eukprot:755466-Hanusia_phi.AAC.3